MHVVFRESHGLEETETPFDVGQDPADLVVLSFSDSDLGAFTAGYERMRRVGNTAHPTVRLANIIALKHPVSVDTYAERTLSAAKAILVRLIGGEAYWPYGLATLQDLARRQGIALAILPADGPIRQLRRWARQFYPSTAAAPAGRGLGPAIDEVRP